MANWCVSGCCNSYRVNSSAAASGTLKRQSTNRIFGNIAGGVYHISRRKCRRDCILQCRSRARPELLLQICNVILLHIIGDEWLLTESGKQQGVLWRWSALPPRFPPSQSNNSSPRDT